MSSSLHRDVCGLASGCPEPIDPGPCSHVILDPIGALPCAEDPCLGWLRWPFLASEPAAPWTPGTGALWHAHIVVSAIGAVALFWLGNTEKNCGPSLSTTVDELARRRPPVRDTPNPLMPLKKMCA